VGDCGCIKGCQNSLCLLASSSSKCVKFTVVTGLASNSHNGDCGPCVDKQVVKDCCGATELKVEPLRCCLDETEGGSGQTRWQAGCRCVPCCPDQEFVVSGDNINPPPCYTGSKPTFARFGGDHTTQGGENCLDSPGANYPVGPVTIVLGAVPDCDATQDNTENAFATVTCAASGLCYSGFGSPVAEFQTVYECDKCAPKPEPQ